MNVNVYKKAQRINVRNQRAQEMGQIGIEFESRLSMIQMLIPLGLRAVEEELQAEVRTLIGGDRYGRTGGGKKRWGTNPGVVQEKPCPDCFFSESVFVKKTQSHFVYSVLDCPKT